MRGHSVSMLRAARQLLISFLALTIAAVGLAQPAHAASGAITVEAVSQFDGDVYYPSGTGADDFSMPTGETFSFAVNYTCQSLTEECVGGEVKVFIPSGLTMLESNYPVGDVDSVDTSDGNNRVYKLKTLTAGASAQISYKLGVPGSVTPDLTLYSLYAASSTESGTSNNQTTPTLKVRARAAATHSTSAVVTSGGAVGTKTKINVEACIDSMQDGFGIIGVKASSTLVVTVPAKVTEIDPMLGTYNAGNRTITWTLDAINAAGCASRAFNVMLPDPGVSVGESLPFDLVWSGIPADSNGGAIVLDETEAIIGVTKPATGGSGLKSAFGPLAPSTTAYQAAGSVGDNITYILEFQNSGTTRWTSAVSKDEIPEIYKPTKLVFGTIRTGDAGTGWIKTNFGPDGVDGNSDDNQLFKVADIAAGGSIEVLPYETTGVTGLPLAADDKVTYVEMRFGGIDFGLSGTAVLMIGEILSTYSDGTPVRIGETFSNVLRTEVVDQTGQSNFRSEAVTEIKVPVMRVQMRAGWVVYAGGSYWPVYGDMDNAPADGQLTENERVVTGAYTAWAREIDLANPRISIVLPKNVRFISADFCPLASCTDMESSANPTITVTEDIGQTGKTVVLFSFPKGSKLKLNGAYSVYVTMYIGKGNYGVVNVPGAWSSASGPVSDVEGYFTPVFDSETVDHDGDGDYPEALGQWPAGFPMPNIVAANVNASVQGSWDLSYATAPAVSYTSPGANDLLKAQFVNDGTTGLTNVRVVTMLARPGDDGSVTATPRNALSNTFPMILRGKPVVTAQNLAGDFSEAYVMYWTTEVNPCIPEVGNHQPGGCTAANWTNWDDQAPADVTAVTGVLVDFVGNRAIPGDAWSVEYPVTSPTAGANESDWADYANSDDPATYETSNASFGMVATPFDMTSGDVGLPLSRSESLAVTMAMPSENGPMAPPNPAAISNYTYKNVAKTITLPILPSGETWLLDENDNEVTTVTLSGQGTYVLNQVTGALVFTPARNYTGWPPAIDYRVYNKFDLSGTATIRTRVLPPTVTAPKLATESLDYTPQSPSLTVPEGGNVRLIDNGNLVTTLTIDGEGTYTVDTTTNVITFTPEAGFLGSSTVRYRLTGAEGDYMDNDYKASVGLTVPSYETSKQDYTKQTTPAASEGRTRFIVDENGNEIRNWTIDNVGTFSVNALSGAIEFLPIEGFFGSQTITYLEYGPNGTSATNSYTVEVITVSVSDQESTDTDWDPQSTTLPDLPGGASIGFPYGEGEWTDSVVVDGVGTFVYDDELEEIIFTPEEGFYGEYEQTFALLGTNFSELYTYTVSVTANVSNVSTTRIDELVHVKDLNLASGLELVLLGVEDEEVTSFEVEGKGTFAIDENGDLTFTPIAGFKGTATITFRVKAANGYFVDAVYTATVGGGEVLKRKVVWLYFDEVSPKLTKQSLKKLKALPQQIVKATAIGYVQGYKPAGNAQSLSKARALNAAKWLKLVRKVAAVPSVAKGVSKFRDYRGRSVKVTVTYKVVPNLD